MGHGYTGNHPRYTMIHDRELIYDAKQQLRRADKSMHAYDDKKHAGKKIGDADETLMAHDRAATKMLPGKIHPLSDVYGRVRNLETYMPVDDRAATKKLNKGGEKIDAMGDGDGDVDANDFSIMRDGAKKKGCSYKR
tara:strand:- start:375 stop:785 length:411 start_codon:yes stop_codon:yes gene_type:complete